MESDEKDETLRETGTAYVTEAAEKEEMMRVYFDVPQSLWKRFIRWAEEHHLSSTDALLSLIRRHVSPPVEVPTGFYADLTRRYLRGELERTGSILDFRLSEEESKAFAESLCQEYGTDDVVEIIDRLRDRGNVGY
jgi:hypothetical protein